MSHSSHMNLTTDTVYFKQHNPSKPWYTIGNWAFHFLGQRPPGRQEDRWMPCLILWRPVLIFRISSTQPWAWPRTWWEEVGISLGSTQNVLLSGSELWSLLLPHRTNSITIRGCIWVPSSSFAWWGWNGAPSFSFSVVWLLPNLAVTNCSS